ncbi:proteophosphoglycan ppg4 [Angomonas deanei]|uniref:Uncharacterized protein n=1 Tax=Angomonas deanei TaxID=59799 RepID=A0A7G2CCY8_9TRYP|nr:proteophosphoglycan ppg4 [Angomonas deanei]CAD2216807.1 hypothetical protein, conserved [Angomonas deanei]|eukprot:EPY23504.1 proteophosphoglycan ppg4 [Angomonas deanei]
MSRSPNSLQQNSDRRLTVDSIADSSPTSTHNSAATDSNSRMRDKTLNNSKSCSQPSSASGSKVERRKTSKSMSSMRTLNSNSSPPSAAPARVMTEPNFTHKAPAPTEPVNSSTNSSLPKDAPEVTARPALPDDSSSDESTESAPPKMLRTRVHHTVTSQEESLKSPTSPVDVLSPKMSSTKRLPEKEMPKESPKKTAKEAPKTDKKKKGEPSQRLLHASGKQSPPTPLVSEEQGSGNKKVKMRRKVSL